MPSHTGTVAISLTPSLTRPFPTHRNTFVSNHGNCRCSHVPYLAKPKVMRGKATMPLNVRNGRQRTTDETIPGLAIRSPPRTRSVVSYSRLSLAQPGRLSFRARPSPAQSSAVSSSTQRSLAQSSAVSRTDLGHLCLSSAVSRSARSSLAQSSVVSRSELGRLSLGAVRSWSCADLPLRHRHVDNAAAAAADGDDDDTIVLQRRRKAARRGRSRLSVERRSRWNAARRAEGCRPTARPDERWPRR